MKHEVASDDLDRSVPSSALGDLQDAGVADEGVDPTWEAELRYRRAQALAMGGPAQVEAQHARGKWTARERISAFLDEDSFQEIGGLTGTGEYGPDGRLFSVAPANVVTGTGRVADRHVAVVAEDYTIRGGSSEATSPDKWQFTERLALEYRMPLVRFVDTAGGSVKNVLRDGLTKIPGYARWPLGELLGAVPVVGVAVGAAAGFGAVRVVVSHFSVMVRETSFVFAAGPAVVRAGIGEEVTKHELGGSQMHVRQSGMVDNEAEDEADALAQVTTFLSYLPSSVFELPPVASCDDDPARRDEALATAIPEQSRRAYDMRAILKAVLDRGSEFEIGRFHGRSAITMLGRLQGHPVALLANDPYQTGGALTAESAEKLTRFIDLADTFHIPVVNFVDQPGTMVGRDAERKATVRVGMRAQVAMEQAAVPWATVFLRRVYGLAGGAYGPLTRGVDWRVAWPTARWGSIGVAGGVDAAYAREIQDADDPRARREELIAAVERVASPFRTAERFGVNDIIDPRDTRRLLCEWVLQAYRLLPEQLGPRLRSMRC